MTDVLNLYAGIGGNRKRWDGVNVTAVEWDERRAECYRDHFPNDDIVVADAHDYLLQNHGNYDFVWTSPPCPTHSKMRRLHPHADDVYPDMRLYQEILLLKHTFEGDWVVENVEPYYDPLVEPQIRGRHAFWSNFHIPPIEMEAQGVRRDGGSSIAELEDMFGFDTAGYKFDKRERRKTLNNCVHPELGEHVFDAATVNRQSTLTGTFAATDGGHDD